MSSSIGKSTPTSFSWDTIKVDGHSALDDIQRNQGPQHLLARLNYDFNKTISYENSKTNKGFDKSKTNQVVEITVNTKDRNGETLLDAAIRLGRVDVVGMVVGAGAIVTNTDTSGATPLHVASQKGQIETVSAIVKKSGSSIIDARNAEGNTPLHLALLNNHNEIAKYLVKHKANLDQANNNGTTPKMVSEEMKIEIAGK